MNISHYNFANNLMQPQNKLRQIIFFVCFPFDQTEIFAGDEFNKSICWCNVMQQCYKPRKKAFETSHMHLGMFLLKCDWVSCFKAQQQHEDLRVNFLKWNPILVNT